MLRILLSFSLLHSAFCLGAWGQGTAFIYQGRLHQGDSPATNGWYYFQFDAYSEATGGSPLGNHVLLTLPVTNGLFTAEVDFGDGVFTGEARWLEIHVSPFGTPGRPWLLEPRQPITPTPYALYALSAGGSSTPLGEGVVSNVNLTANCVTTDKIADRTITEGDVQTNTFWNVGGNVMTRPPDDFIGTIDALPFWIRVNNMHAMRFEPGDPPNVIGGFEGNSVGEPVRGATIGGGGENGNPNQVMADFGTIAGGGGNSVTDTQGTVGGGYGNLVTARGATISGGVENQSGNNDATVGGGWANIAGGLRSTVGGGYVNHALAAYATIAGGGPDNEGDPYGSNNRVFDDYGTIGGGGGNQAGSDDGSPDNATFATVSGGEQNRATGEFAAVGGGYGNEAAAAGAVVGGGGWYNGSALPNRALGSASTISGGISNAIDRWTEWATIGGGWFNTVQPDADGATIGGGGDNTIQQDACYATIGGGGDNKIQTNACNTTIGGGVGNKVQTYASQATIAGGYFNSIMEEAHFASIGGGNENRITDFSGTIGGGANNEAGNDNFVPDDACYATVSGGQSNKAWGAYSTVGGGQGNQAWLAYTTIAGGGPSDPEDLTTANRVTDIYGFVGGGGGNLAGNDNTLIEDAKYATVSGGENNEARAIHSTIGGGQANLIGTNADSATIGGGYLNTNLAIDATIGGGIGNRIESNADDSTIGGGYHNTIDFALNSTIGGGDLNRIGPFSISSTIGGGSDNWIQPNAYFSTIGGGTGNVIQGIANSATIPGGAGNHACAHFSFAAGHRAKALHNGAFVWADSQEADFSSTAENSVFFRCSGGVLFTSGSGNLNHTVAWAPGFASWRFSSDRNLKERFSPVNGGQVLEKVLKLPISEWNFIGYASRHIGPTAQDFHEHFPLEGSSDTMLNGADLHGVGLAAIQGLNQKLEARCQALEARLEQKETEIEQLNQKTSRMDELERRLLAMEKLLNQQTAMISGGEQ